MNLIPADTTIDALRKQFEILERIGIEGRAEMTFQLSDKARQELIDDMKKHVEVAVSLGMKGIHFISAQQLNDELAIKLNSTKGLRDLETYSE